MLWRARAYNKPPHFVWGDTRDACEALFAKLVALTLLIGNVTIGTLAHPL
jgi:hypothetical protein